MRVHADYGSRHPYARMLLRISPSVRPIMVALVAIAMKLATRPLQSAPMSSRLFTSSSIKISTKGRRIPLAICEIKITFSSGKMRNQHKPRSEHDQPGIKSAKMGASPARRSTPDSNPKPSQML